MQRCNDLCRFDVDGFLIPEGSQLDANDEAEFRDMPRKLFQRECEFPGLFAIMQFKGLEVAHQDIARPLALGEGVEVHTRLRVALLEVAPAVLLLDREHAWPEQVDVARTIVELPSVLLVSRDGAASDSEDCEEVSVEAPRLAGFAGSILPHLGELSRLVANLVPRESHRLLLDGDQFRGIRIARTVKTELQTHHADPRGRTNNGRSDRTGIRHADLLRLRAPLRNIISKPS